MEQTQKYSETVNCFRGAAILSGDSYLIENDSWYQVVSPSRKDASRNEIIYSSLDEGNVEKKIEQTIDFYKKIGTSFKWCTGPETRPVNMAEKLREAGFRSWQARGMCCDPKKIDIDKNNAVSIERVTLANLDSYLDAFIEGWSIDDSMRSLLEEDYQWALSEKDERFHYFIGKANGEVVGTAGFIRKPRSAYLVCGNVLERFRGEGYYKALIKERLDLILSLGLNLATTGARELTSAPILEKLGFETIYKSEIFQYDF